MELSYKIYKQSMQLNIRKKTQLKNRQKTKSRHISKDDIQIAKKHMKDAQHHKLLEKCR